MLQSHETVNPSLRAMLHLCPLTPTHTAEDLGITLDQLSAMLGNARTSNYHTRPPPCESKSKEAKKPPPRFGYASGQFPYCFTTSSQLLKAVNKKKAPLVSSSSTSVLSSPGQSAASTPSNGGGGYNLSGNDFGQQQDYSPVGGDGLRGSSASSPHGPTISASVAGSVFAAADGSVDATTLVTNAPPINARHCSLFFEIYAAQGGKYSLEMMERLMRFCTHNPPEFVLKVQLTALHLFLHVLHLRATYGQGASGGLRHPVDYKSLPRTVVEGILVSSAVVNQSLADEELTPAEAAVSDSSSTGKRAMACLDAVQSFSHLLSSLPVLSRGSPPAFVVSNTHFSFIVDTAAAANHISTCNTNATMDESDMMSLMSGGQPSKDRYFSAQVRITNTIGKDNHANFGTLASSSTNPDQLLMVKLSQYQVRVDGVIVEDEKGSTTKTADKKSNNDRDENDGGDNVVTGMSMYGAPDVQLFLEKESIKRGDSGRLLISLIAKSEATFRSCEIIAVLTIDGVSKVVVTFVVVNPSQPQFATLPPCCLYQHVQESRLGTYDIPLVLQILRQSFQLKQGFAWEEVSKLLSTNLKQHSHTNGQLLSRVLFLQDALDDVATGSSLIPLLWSDPSSGSVLAPNYAMVISSSSSSSSNGVLGGGGVTGGSGGNDVTAVATPAMRTLVPMSSAHPIGYTPGSLFPLNAQSTSSQQSSSHLTLEKILPRACLATYARMLDGSSTADEYEDGAIIVLGGETGSSSSSPPVLVSPEDTLGLIMVFISMFPIPLVDERILTCDPAAYLEAAQPCVQGILLFVIDFCCCLLMYTNDNHTTVRTLALAFAPLLIRSPFFSARRDTHTGRSFSSSPLRPPPSQQLHGMGTYMRNQEAYINEQNSYLSEMGSPPSLDRGSGDFPSRSVSDYRRPLLPQPEEFATFVQLETHVVTALIHWIKRYQKLYTSNHHR